MLASLTIKNFGLIDNLSLEFAPGLNALTGETGAGKSIIVDAFRFALGERPKSPPARLPDAPTVVEAVFEIQDKRLLASELFKEYLPAGETEIIIQRQLLPDGKNKIKLNGLTVTISQLKELGDRLVDFHGPHDHQMLLTESSHREILDQLTDFAGAMEQYEREFQSYSRLRKELEDLQALAGSRDRDLDLLAHQVRELEQVPLSQQAFDELSQEMVKVNNSEKLYGCVSELLGVLEGDETGLSELVRRAFAPMRVLNQVDEKTAGMADDLENLQATSDQLVSSLKDYLSSLSFSPEEAQQLNKKYDIYENIRRKYGPAIEDAAAFYDEAKKKFSLLSDLEHNDRDLKERIAEAESSLKKIAEKMTKARKKTAVFLKETIEKELRDLGIEHVTFEARVEKEPFHSAGADRVVFYISPNAGEEMRPLSQIVSSGEAARTMLALKKALTKVDPIPVLIFDEIDAQIGGRLGTVTGNKLKDLAQRRQVLVITHLPQIASFADRHFKVTKQVSAGRTITRVTELEDKVRVEELAQMMAGKDQDKVSLNHAEQMLAKARKG